MSATGTEPATRAGAGRTPQATGAEHSDADRPATSPAASASTRPSTSCAPTAPPTSSRQVNQKVRGVIEAGGGTLLKVDNWGKRKLAYEVQEAAQGDLPLLLLPRHRRAWSKRSSATCASPTRSSATTR